MGKNVFFFLFGCAMSLLWCVGLSCYRAQTLEHMGFSSCGVWAQLPHSMWGPGSPTRDRT